MREQQDKLQSNERKRVNGVLLIDNDIFSIKKQWYLMVYRNTCTHKQVLLKLIDPIVSCKTQPFLMIHISN